ncbi:cysteine peptidase family C39 domain-containing protein [Niabella aurantiaca]|uniref:cysteine peptidase family C39 domain-containing protein n=1 Tax=Niabella aurantiaca TaxID=379900 RepID=UPI000476F88B|nr:cysteine peptidase family C39 domain-containing protein [Niabella aurantiaca]
MKKSFPDFGFHYQSESSDCGPACDIFPVIIHWRKNHMVVIYHADPQYAYIADPARGKLRYHYDTLKQSWYYPDSAKGAVMAIEPNTESMRQKKNLVNTKRSMVKDPALFKERFQENKQCE